ncbi:MAG: arylsulfatase A-like enzyme [Myxococcota bacterium]|jgi:arylsulfatase A-like enzyme
MKTLLLLVAMSSYCLMGCSHQQESKSNEPQLNVVLISIDSVRRDHLGIYGHRPRYAPEVAVSPHIDALAQEGVVFDDAFSTSSWTLPAHAALMTGRSDVAHGVQTDRFQIDPLHQTLAQAFSAEGYSTAGYYSGPYLGDKYGFDAGFDDYRSGMINNDEFLDMVIDENAKLKAAGRDPMDPQMISQMRDRMSHWDITSPKINKLASDFIEEADDDPFFLFVHYFDAHYDHLPASINPELAKKFDPSYSGDFDSVNWYFDPRVMDTRPPYERKISERDLNHVIAFYDAEINWVDHHIGALIAQLKAKGLWETTVIMIVADHGDEFFEHNSIGHRSTLFAEQVRIPMVLRAPNMARAGSRVSNISRIYDVAPTLLDIASNASLANAEGESLSGDLNGETIVRSAFQNIFSGGHRRSHQLNISDGWRNAQFSVLRSFRYDQKNSTDQYINAIPLLQRATNTPYLVFDRQADPAEHTPLLATNPLYKLALKQYAQAFSQRNEYLSSVKHSSLDACKISSLSAEENHILSQLGYGSSSTEEEADFDIMAIRLGNLPGISD